MIDRRAASRPAGLLIASLLVACGGGSGSSDATAEAPRAEALHVVTVTERLDHPWSVAFLPDGRFLVSERAGRLRVVEADGRLGASVGGLPAVRTGGQAGLFDLALDPDFASNRRLYWSYAEAGVGAEDGTDGLAVARGTLDLKSATVSQVQVILRQTPKVAGSSAHYGGRLAFAPDGRLFVTMGDRQITSQRGFAQDLGRDNGKVARIERDGAIPADNPFRAKAGARPELWSLGHRNPQGATIHPGTGALWTVEHGPQGGDELNQPRAGRNYGWPLVSFGCEYGDPVGRCTPVGGATAAPGLEPPVATWVPLSTAPSGLAIVGGDTLPEWTGQALVGALAGQTLWRIDIAQRDPIVCTPVAGQTASGCTEVAEVKALGRRIRDVRQGPDGWIYLLTDDGGGRDALLRLQR